MKTNQSYNYDPDKLAEKFLGEFYIWHPDDDAPPEQYRDGKRAEWKMKFWRGDFYHWENGRYVRASDSNMSVLVTGFLQDSNRPKFTYDPPDPPIKITTGLVRNVLLNIAGLEGVRIPDQCELNTWPQTDGGGQRTEDGIITISFLNGLLLFSDSGLVTRFL